MIHPVRGTLVIVDGVLLVDTPDGLVQPNLAEEQLSRTEPWGGIDISKMSDEEYDRFRREMLRKRKQQRAK